MAASIASRTPSLRSDCGWIQYQNVNQVGLTISPALGWNGIPSWIRGQDLSATHPPQRLKSFASSKVSPLLRTEKMKLMLANGQATPIFPAPFEKSNIPHSFRRACRSRRNSLLPNPGKKFFRPPPFPSRKFAVGYFCSIDEHHPMRHI